MAIELFRKSGWFDNKTEEVNLPEFSKDQILSVRQGKTVVLENDGFVFTIFLRNKFDLTNLSEDDLIIRKFPIHKK